VGVYDANSNFNDGESSTLELFKLLNITPGIYTTRWSIKNNEKRKRVSTYKGSKPHKKKKEKEEQLLDTKKKTDGRYIETEGTTYEYGGY